MINPNMPNIPNMPNMPNIPGMGAMTDTLEFVKNLWGSMGIPGMNMQAMNVPGMVMPTLSVEEINKRIADMRAVESWLTLNMNMLRATIQALEVQAATISTLQSMGESFSATMGAAMQEPAPAPVAAAPNGAHAGNGTQEAPAATGNEKQHAAPQPSRKDESDAASLTAPLVNAAAWWNMLQDQFKQAVSGAMSAEPAAASTDKPKAKARTKAAAPAKPAATASAARKRKTAK